LSPEHEVLTVSDGGKALTILKDHPVEVVITDIYMPGVDGFEIIREIARTNAATAIIAMSGQWGKFGTNMTGVALALGADYLLAKPFNRVEALQAVSVVLQMRNIAP